jgi:glycosyltransferase involved in cell wall biosynthesis
VRRRTKAVPPSPDFAPVRMDEVELGAPLPALSPGESGSGAPFAASLCLVRLHGRPLGLLEVELPPGGLAAAELASQVAAAFGERAADHLREDGLPAAAIAASGIAGPDRPACAAERDAQLADPPSLSVVICTRNRPDSVRLTLRSILACRYPAERWEAIVVDNASEADPSIAAAAEVEGPVPVRVVHEPEPGLSNARNLGLRHAGGEIVVFADDDVEVDREWLAVLAAPFQREERVGATSGLTLPGSLETPAQRWTEGFGGRQRPLAARTFDLAEPPPDNPLFPFTVGELGAGRNMAFRRPLLERLGGFDPALGPGSLAHDGDDIEALLRVLLSGHSVVHDPAAIVWHAHPRDYEELRDRVWGYGIGLTACLTRAIIDHPGLLLDLVRKLPRGLVFALSPSSEKNVGRQRDFPRSLARRELLGNAYGPIAYLRSRRRARARRRRRMAEGAAADGSGPAAGGLSLLFVSDEYRPVIGGAARSVEQLARGLADRGHTVTIATAWQPDTPAFEERDGVSVYRIRDLSSRVRWLSDDPHRHHAPPFPDPEATLRLRRLIRAVEPDLVHAYGWLAHSTAVAMRRSKTPMMVSAHDYGNICSVFTLVRKGREPCSGPGPGKCLDCASFTYGPAKGAVAVASVFGSWPLLRRRVDALHGVSNRVTEMVGGTLRVPAEATAVIPNMLDEEIAEPADEEILARLPKEAFIMFVGHLRLYKGIRQLLDAYTSLDDAPPLVLVGTKGPDTPSSFPPGVTVLTFVPHPTVMAMWERALFAVSPSIAPETGPIVAQEAMSRGRAVIGARAAGYLDLIEDGETGLLVPPGDSTALAEAMARLIEDEALRERLGRNARETSRRFASERIVPRFESLYREAIARTSRGAA